MRTKEECQKAIGGLLEMMTADMHDIAFLCRRHAEMQRVLEEWEEIEKVEPARKIEGGGMSFSSSRKGSTL